MIKLKCGIKSSICLMGLVLGGEVVADDRLIYGSLDDFSKNEVVISDRSVPVSKLVSCQDFNGRTLVGCSGVNRVKWVQGTINADGVVTKLKQLTDEQYKQVAKNND